MLGWLAQVTLPHMLCSRLALTWDYPSPCAPPQMTKSLISFPANLEMVNNETDVTGPQPGSWCAHYGNGRNNSGFQSFNQCQVAVWDVQGFCTRG
jgi:hypothetical protein